MPAAQAVECPLDFASIICIIYRRYVNLQILPKRSNIKISVDLCATLKVGQYLVFCEWPFARYKNDIIILL